MNLPVHQGRPRGFTLIELLVVIVIISILAALLLPALKNARDSAKMAGCVNLLKQMGMSNHMYAGDWNEWFVPIAQANSSSDTGENTYWNTNTAYRDQLGVASSANVSSWPSGMACPMATKCLKTSGNSGNQNGWVTIGYSWGFNTQGNCNTPPTKGVVRTPSGTYPCFWGYQRFEVPNPSAKIMLLDSTDWYITSGMNVYTEDSSSVGFSFRHNGGADISFCDGHVEYMKASAVWNVTKLWTVFLQ